MAGCGRRPDNSTYGPERLTHDAALPRPARRAHRRAQRSARPNECSRLFDSIKKIDERMHGDQVALGICREGTVQNTPAA